MREREKKYLALVEFLSLEMDTSLRSRCEPVWPSGKAFRLVIKEKGLSSIPLRLSFLFESCDLWTLSCDFSLHN